VSDGTTLLQGGCLCGAVRYQIRRKIHFVVQCFCRDCQKATGTGHTTIVGVEAQDLITTGQPATYTSAGDTGGRVTRHFCAQCASRLYTSGDLPGAIRMVQAGTLDSPAAVTPTSAIYLKDRIPWDLVDPTLEHFQAMPEKISASRPT